MGSGTNQFTWVSYERFVGALGGGHFGDLFREGDASFDLDAELVAALLGPPARVEGSDGLGPLHLWFADGHARMVLACLPSAPEPTTWMVVRPVLPLPLLLEQLAMLPPPFRSNMSFIRGEGEHAIFRLTRYGFAAPLFCGMAEEVSAVLERLAEWGVPYARIDRWRADPEDASWIIERSGKEWARYGDQLGALFVAAGASLAEQNEQRVRCEQTREVIATFVCGRLA